jgi:hypothetical protein
MAGPAFAPDTLKTIAAQVFPALHEIYAMLIHAHLSGA